MRQRSQATAPVAAEDPQKTRIEDAIKAKAEEVADEAQVLQPIDLDDEDDAIPTKDDLPDWATIPDHVKVPDGWQIWFLRFRGSWTNTPNKGDRTCILWNLSESDMKLAGRRARGDGWRVIEEMAKQMVRVVDGVRADWSGAKGAGSVDAFWNEIGGKCQYQVKNLYLKTHTMSSEENADFFAECCAVRTAG